VTWTIHGRCKSGSRWFWIAAAFDGDEAHKCDDPVCIYGGPHEYGWENTEDLALKAMAEAVGRLGGEVRQGCYKGNAPGQASAASSALKRLNAASYRRGGADPGQRHQRTVPAECVRPGGQVPDQLVGRAGDVQLGLTLCPPCHDAGEVERHAEVRSLRLEEAPGELPQPGRLGLGGVQDHLDVHAGTLTSGADI
jgi:hypothetical protein